MKDTELAKTVLDSLLGQLLPEHHLSWVENIFVPGHPCHESYHRMRLAYCHLLERLNEVDEDEDAERMVMCLLEYSDIIALEMFKYGRKYQKNAGCGRINNRALLMECPQAVEKPQFCVRQDRGS